MNQTQKELILAFLREHGVSYRAFSHPVANTMEEKKANDARAGVFDATHCKNLVLTNRTGRDLYLLTIPFESRFRTGPVSRQMASSRLSFAEEGVLQGILRTQSGMVSPLELIFDREKRIHFFMEQTLAQKKLLCFHPGDDTCTVVMTPRAFLEGFLPAAGISAGFVDINYSEEN